MENKIEKGKLKPFPKKTTEMPKCWDAITWDENGNEIPKEELDLKKFMDKSYNAFKKMDDDYEDLLCGDWKTRRK